MASLQRNSAHTKYHSGAGGFQIPWGWGGESHFQGKAEAGEPSPVSLPPLHLRGAGCWGWSGLRLSGREMPVLPITLCLMSHMIPCSREPHGKEHVSSLGWEPVPLQEQGGARVESREHRWGTATTPAIDGAISARHTIVLPPASSSVVAPSCCPVWGWPL